jgi:phage gpG-like protein
MPIDRWTPGKIQAAAEAQLAQRMQAAVLVLQGEVQRKLSVGQPVRRSKVTGRQYGTTKAAPAPTPPRVLTGALRKSITHDVKRSPGLITGRVGANTKYARRLEMGFFGTDSRGRNVNAPARPYLRSALKENLRRLVAILQRAG